MPTMYSARGLHNIIIIIMIITRLYYTHEAYYASRYRDGQTYLCNAVIVHVASQAIHLTVNIVPGKLGVRILEHNFRPNYYSV